MSITFTHSLTHSRSMHKSSLTLGFVFWFCSVNSPMISPIQLAILQYTTVELSGRIVKSNHSLPLPHLPTHSLLPTSLPHSLTRVNKQLHPATTLIQPGQNRRPQYTYFALRATTLPPYLGVFKNSRRCRAIL